MNKENENNLHDFDKEDEIEINKRLHIFKLKYRSSTGKDPDDKLLQKERKIIIKKYLFKDKEGITQVEKEQGQMHCIYELLRNERKHLSFEEMSQYLINSGYTYGSSVKTIYKRIRPILIEKGAKKDKEGKWYFPEYKRNPEFEKQLEEEYSEEMETTAFISNLLDIIKGSPVYDKTKEYIDRELNRYQRRLNSNNESEENLYVSRVIFLGAPAAKIDNDFWNILHNAMMENQIVKLSYIGEGKTEAEQYTVKPYQLIFDNGFWELWGACTTFEHRGTRLFNLSRIVDVEVFESAEKFELPEMYDFRSTLAGNFGCFNDNIVEDYSIKIKKDSYAYLYIKDRIWGEFQEITEVDDSYILEFEASQYKPILRWVLGWGADVEPLAPKNLVDDWKKSIFEMSKKI